ncbi:hypothetical protein PR048_006061 [Dryococelus australis]|uniref:Uncharacterized protein n=1 Tax=Dryococelus australis TaxID=614101 RepID=A0ABQ9I9X3_9NEOP|nr:hypothetical protein PR048_006061 [Dryococelus australis]
MPYSEPRRGVAEKMNDSSKKLGAPVRSFRAYSVGGKGLVPGCASCEEAAASDDENRTRVNTEFGDKMFNVTTCTGRGHPNSITWGTISAELRVLTCHLE